jgi:hypothetical protein
MCDTSTLGIGWKEDFVRLHGLSELRRANDGNDFAGAVDIHPPGVSVHGSRVTYV